MEKDSFTKKQRRHIRELAGKVYEIRLEAALDELLKNFEDWKSGKINAFDLENIVHKFHDGKARDLYKRFVMGNYPDSNVAWALNDGLITEEDIEESCRPRILKIAELYSKNDD